MILAKIISFVKGLPDWFWWLLLIIAGGTFIDVRARMQQRAKDKTAEGERTRKTIDKIEEKSDARIEQADRIRASNPVSGDPDRVSERPLPDYHYRD